MKYSSMSMSSTKYLLFVSKFPSLSPSLNSIFFSDAVRGVLRVGEILGDAVSGVVDASVALEERGGGGGVDGVGQDGSGGGLGGRLSFLFLLFSSRILLIRAMFFFALVGRGILVVLTTVQYKYH